MPQLGDIKKAKELGLKSNKGSAQYLYYACSDCGKQSWKRLRKGKVESQRCLNCGARDRV
ncbi:hypothetical protein LCGC14_1886050, partial [marine sediment metagenome]